MVRYVHIQRIAHKADVVAFDAGASGVVQLHAVAALRRVHIAQAGDGVVLHPHIVGLFNPQAEQVVGEVVLAHHGAVRAGVDVDARVLILEAGARVAHDQAFQHHIGGSDADGVAHLPAAERGAVDAAQRQRLVDAQVHAVKTPFHLHCVARGGSLHGGLQILTGLHAHGGGAGRLAEQAGGQGQQREGGKVRLHHANPTSVLMARNKAAPISRFLKPT